MTLISVLSISENQAKIYVKKLLQEVSGSAIYFLLKIQTSAVSRLKSTIELSPWKMGKGFIRFIEL